MSATTRARRRLAAPSRAGALDVRLGAAVLHLVVPGAATTTAQASAVGRAVAVLVPGLALGLPVPLLAAAAAVGAASAHLGGRSAARHRAQGLELAAVDALDLFGLALGAGSGLHSAIALVGARVRGPVGAALVAAHADSGRGELLAAALARRLEPLAAEAPSVGRLLLVLDTGLADGAALGGLLARQADETRRAGRQRAEARARRIPVLLLFPLVTCTLPAFGLLTLGPVVVPTLLHPRP